MRIFFCEPSVQGQEPMGSVGGSEAEEIQPEHVGLLGIGVSAGGLYGEGVLSFFNADFSERNLAGVGNAVGLVEVVVFTNLFTIE